MDSIPIKTPLTTCHMVCDIVAMSRTAISRAVFDRLAFEEARRGGSAVRGYVEPLHIPSQTETLPPFQKRPATAKSWVDCISADGAAKQSAIEASNVVSRHIPTPVSFRAWLSDRFSDDSLHRAAKFWTFYNAATSNDGSLLGPSFANFKAYRSPCDDDAEPYLSANNIAEIWEIVRHELDVADFDNSATTAEIYGYIRKVLRDAVGKRVRFIFVSSSNASQDHVSAGPSTRELVNSFALLTGKSPPHEVVTFAANSGETFQPNEEESHELFRRQVYRRGGAWALSAESPGPSRKARTATDRLSQGRTYDRRMPIHRSRPDRKTRRKAAALLCAHSRPMVGLFQLGPRRSHRSAPRKDLRSA